jgi:hypothetical protein
MSRRIPTKLAALFAALLMAFMLGAAPVLAASNRTNSPKLPGGDYIQTNIWIGNMPFNTFDAQSSTWVIGNNPYYPYYTEDSLAINVNGIAISVSWPPSANQTTFSSATFVNSQTYTGYAGNAVYNITVLGGLWFNNSGVDTSKTILWKNTQSFYNHSGVTNWCC